MLLVLSIYQGLDVSKEYICDINSLLSTVSKDNRKIGLVLGSGAARGWAHIGVIRALEEAGVRINYIAGTSIGALIGAAFADGKIKLLEDYALKLTWKTILEFFDISLSHSGIIDGKKIADFLRKHSHDAQIDSLAIPFSAVSTDILTGREVVFKNGSVIDAVRASISIPGIFTPVKMDDAILVDGALLNPLPVNVVKDMGSDFVIAVDINFGTEAFSEKRKLKKKAKQIEIDESPVVESDEETKKSILEKKGKNIGMGIAGIEYFTLNRMKEWIARDSIPNIFEIMLASYNILEVQVTLSRLKIDPADVLIRPKLAHIDLLDFDRAKEAIDEGYRAAMEQMDSIQLLWAAQ